MPIAAIGAALLSALIHASWNAVLKGGNDRVADAFMVALGSTSLALGLIAWLGPPPAEAWPYLAVSVCIHIGYWYTLMKGYDAGDLSHVYTLSRGMAPLLVAIGAALTAAEIPAPLKLFGIVLVSAGVLLVGASPHAPLRATLWAGAIGLCIAGYSLNDALGSRVAGNALQFVAWSSLFTGIAMLSFGLWRRGPKRLLAVGGAASLRGLIVGPVSVAGYALVLWAQTIAPIAQVTALRETSVVFAALIAFLLLHERLGARRWIGAGVVAAGAGLIAFG
ncbi:MAG TPA: DMT family transporter [Terricaulis sp.]|nr:DMT family transporter [Terricaulis sp.]